MQPDQEKADNLVAQDLLDEIREQLSARDAAVLDQLLEGYDPEKLDANFYRKALQHRNRFIRDWFRFDLDLRNLTVSYINDALGRQESQDVVRLEGRETEEFPEAAAAQRGNYTDLAQPEGVLRPTDTSGRGGLPVHIYESIPAFRISR